VRGASKPVRGGVRYVCARACVRAGEPSPSPRVLRAGSPALLVIPYVTSASDAHTRCISTSACGLVGGVSLIVPPPIAKAESRSEPRLRAQPAHQFAQCPSGMERQRREAWHSGNRHHPDPKSDATPRSLGRQSHDAARSSTKVHRFASRHAVLQRRTVGLRHGSSLQTPREVIVSRLIRRHPSPAIAVVLFAPSALAGTSYAEIRLPAPSAGTNGP
jgi:hypothetical protein